MSSDRSLLERQMERVELRPFTLEGFHRRRQRKERNRRIRAGVAALVVAAAGAGGLIRAFSFSSGLVPAGDPRGPFLGIWVTTDLDGSTQTMTVRATGDGAVEIAVNPYAASVCPGVASSMTGTGRLEGARELVIPSPVLTCADRSEPTALAQEQLRNLTFVHHPQTDSLTDNFGSVWERLRGYDPEATLLGGMWPQTSLEEVRKAQRLADAGDPRYTWQVEPELGANLDDAQIFFAPFLQEGLVARFLREELGWEEFLWNSWTFRDGQEGGEPSDRSINGVVYIRCAPGRTNPLYPDDPGHGGCAPTIDEFRYETVEVALAQPDRRGPSGIWVVTRWQMLPPVRQVVPPSDAEVAELLNAFLRARVTGEGAERYLNDPEGDIPLLYATTAGASYERSQFERVDGPNWPNGDLVFKVRLFAEGGKTVVEQFLSVERDRTGRLGLYYYFNDPDHVPTTENGQPIS